MAYRRFPDLVGTEHPIVQAPMAGAGGAALAIGAIQGGALGSLPCGLLSPWQIRDQVHEVRTKVEGPLNLNFFCHAMPPTPDDGEWRALLAPYYEQLSLAPTAHVSPLRLPFDAEMCELVEELRPEVVSFHFGLPEPNLLNRVQGTGALVFGNATTVAEARWLAKRGVDVVIAQGFEAGGHAGHFLPADPWAVLGLMALLPQVVDAVPVPVIAAGGIGDPRGIAAAFLLGASAVQIGTAFLHCPESLITAGHRAALRSDEAETTVMTNLLTGRLARGIANRLMKELGPVRSEAPPYPYAAAALAPLREAAEALGDSDFSPLWAGQSARLGRALPAAELTRSLAGEALALLASGLEEKS